MKDDNGTRYIITALSSNLITAKKLGANDDEPLLLIPHVIHLTKNDEFPFIMKHVQFPVKLAYVMTFQRAQGQSLDKCRILLNRSVWTHGQLCVAMSRCGAMSQVKILQIKQNWKNSISHQIIIIHEMLSTQKFST